MGIATLDLSSELFMEFAKACKGRGVRRFVVKENALPDDAKIIRVGLRDPSDPFTLRLYIESEAFAEVPEGATTFPEVPPMLFETIYERAA